MTTLYETSRLTLELRDLVDNGDNSVDIWNFDYPSYYEGDKKTAFERKVIDHFYFRQIGQETVGRFLHCFRTKIREIMPYYIQLYKSQEIMENLEDPFGNVDITETFRQTSNDKTTGTQSGESSGTVNGESNNSVTSSSESNSTDDKTITEDKIRKFSNTPQGSISNVETFMSEGTIEDNGGTEKIVNDSSGSSESTSSGASKETSTGTSSLESTEEKNGTLEHTFTKKGNQGVNTYAHDMKEYRETFLNIDMMIINDLNELFLGVY